LRFSTKQGDLHFHVLEDLRTGLVNILSQGTFHHTNEEAEARRGRAEVNLA
jgi:hypothetical protein